MDYKQKLNHALSLRDLELFDEAIELLSGFEASAMQDPKYLMVCGSVYFLANRYEDAVVCFERLILLKPESELASTSLFQSYWNIAEFRKAVVEMDRYLAQGCKAHVYLAILSEHYPQLNAEDDELEKSIITKYFHLYFGAQKEN